MFSVAMSILGRILAFPIPNGTKRAIFIVSLYSRIKNLDTFQADLIHKLNTALVVSQDEKALEFPLLISKAVWHHKGTCQIFLINDANEISTTDEKQIENLAFRVLTTVPKWLKYSDDEVMRNDVMQILKVC